MVQESLEILGLNNYPTLEELKKAHRRLIKKFHPDLFMHKPSARLKAEELTKKINLAVETIKAYLSEAKEEVKPYTVKNQSWQNKKPAYQNFYQYQAEETTEAGILDEMLYRLNRGWSRILANSYMFASLAGCYVVLKKAHLVNSTSLIDFNLISEMVNKLTNF